MANYLDTIDSYDLVPFDWFEDEDFEYEYSDPVRQIQIRLVFIFAMAAMVAVILSLLALPVQIGTGSAAAESVNVVANQPSSIEAPSDSGLLVAPAGVSGIADLFTPEVQYWEPEIIKWAGQHNVDPNAVATIMQIESCGDPQAVSTAGARGLFQVMPFHFSSTEDMLDPDTNARRGLDFLNEQLRYTGGDIFLSFAGYNGGYAASGGNYENWANETQRYYQWAKGIYEDARSGAQSSATLDAWLDAGGRPGCERAAGRLGI